METLTKLITLLQHYMGKKFYGKIEVAIESGNIVNVKVTENIKL
jgi:hypothetical protein